MKLTPMAGFILINVQKKEEKTYGGLYIPETVEDHEKQYIKGVVVAVGENEVTEKGVAVPHQVEVGMTVLAEINEGTILRDGGEEYRLTKEKFLLGVEE